MRMFALALLLAAAVAPAAAQEPPPGLEVDTIALAPGEAVVIAFEQGFDHQLLRVRHRGAEALTAPLAAGEVRAHFTSDGGRSALEVENGAGEPLYFDALADRSGRGGFSPVPVTSVPAGRRAVAGSWAFAIATLTLGEFSYGPHGDHEH